MGSLLFHPLWFLYTSNQFLAQDFSLSVFFLRFYGIFELCIVVVPVGSSGDYSGLLV
jgi:hypothetical protein